MNLTVNPGILRGTVSAIPSKSHAHRALICAAFADGPTTIFCRETSRDIEATVRCLNSLGASITRTSQGYEVIPPTSFPESAVLNCGESGSTLRFLLPLVGVLGIDGLFHLEGRLPQRPLSPLWEEMERMGCKLSRPSGNTLRCQGQLKSGSYHIPGNITSQYITGLLLSLIHLERESGISISGTLESRLYVELTLKTMVQFGVFVTPDRIPGKQILKTPKTLAVEGDWSNAAFFLAANALGNSICVEGLNRDSVQGDHAVVDLLPTFGECPVISAADIPDLIPILSVVAAFNHGAVFTNIQRLRTKESDRVDAIVQMIRSLGGNAEANDNTLRIRGTSLAGGTVNAFNDHRIAMSAAIAATKCNHSVTILGAECVYKSYPLFWEEYQRLGGNYEQYIR